MVIGNLWRFQSCLSLYRLQLARCAMQYRGMANIIGQDVVWSENYRDQNLPFRKFQPKKRLPKILGDVLTVKIR